MFLNKKESRGVMAASVLILSAVGMLTACGQEKEPESLSPVSLEGSLGEEKDTEKEPEKEAEKETEESSAGGGLEAPASGPDSSAGDAAKAAELKAMFGENCIAEQTFEVEMSEYQGKVWFVASAPGADSSELDLQIVQNGEVLTQLPAYVPQNLTGESFRSLDAVSFYDINYDGNTDIILVETYGDTSFAAVYYGFGTDDDGYGRYFMIEDGFSENLTAALDTVSVSEIRNYLAGGRKNGEFSDYREAYGAAARVCALQERADSEWEVDFQLIDVDGDDIPELAAGVPGYYTSLYTYSQGSVYNLMDRWPYGVMGNAGYEYAPGKNSIRNYNSDYAGAILYTTYLSVTGSHTLETTVQIETYNFDDANGNGVPDENEQDSFGSYSVSYIDGREITEGEFNSYGEGEYEFIGGKMSLEALLAELKK